MRKVSIDNFPELDFAATEALNTLCTNLVFCGDSFRRILVTSSQGNEGKSFISLGITKTLASMGYSVLLIDGDLRQSVLSKDYGIHYPPDALGLSHFLSRELNMDDVIYATNFPGAYLLPVGRYVINSMQLLSSWRFEELMSQMAAKVDYIIVDTPPVGAIVDAAVVAKSCDGAILVAASNIPTKQEFMNAKQQIEMSGCPVIGAVLNKTAPDSSGSKYYNRYGYGYGYGYGVRKSDRSGHETPKEK